MSIIEHLLKTTEKDSISIYVPTPETSIQLQNYLFTLGYHWVSGKISSYTSSNCIHVYKDDFSLTYSHIRDTLISSTIIPYNKIIPNLKKLH